MKNWSPRFVAATLALVVTGWVVLAWPWLSGHVTIPFDAKAHFQAQLQFLATALHTGQSPFWAPNVFAGSPQVADPQSLIFSPALILALLNPTPSFRVVDAYVLTLLLAGSCALVMLFRDRNWHPAGAVVAALAFAFGASAAWRIQHIGQIESFAFFAVSLWTLNAAIIRRSLGWAAAAGLSAGMMFVEPDQVAYIALLILAGFALASTITLWRDKVPLKRINAILAIGGTVFLLVIAVPLTWTMLFAEASNRPEISYSEAVRGALHPAALLTAILGDLFGAGNAKIDFWGPLGNDWSPNNLTLSQNMVQLYTGALPALAVLVLGLSRGLVWSRSIRPITCALIFCLIYALGSATPLFRLFYEVLPGVSAFRRPADATFLIGGLAAILAGYVVHRFATGAVKPASPLRLGAEAAAVFGFLALGAGVSWEAGKLALALEPLGHAAGWLAAAALVLWAMHRFGPARPLAAAAIASGLMVADLSANNGPNQSTALPPLTYDVMNPNCRNETIALIKQLTKMQPGTARRDRVELAGIGFEWPNLGMIHGFDHTLGYNPLRLAEFDEAVGARDTIAGVDQKRFTELYPSYRSTFANLLGLRYIVLPVPIEKVDKKIAPGAFPLIARTKDAYIYENTQALPRAMFVGGWQTVDFETVLEEGFPAHFDPTKTVLIETPIAEGEGPAAQPPQGASKVEIKSYANTQVVIEVTSERAGFLLLNDVWHPWWTATIDGEDAEIVKANVVFRAVQMPAGKHIVRFEFKPVDGAIAELKEKLEDELETKKE